MIHPPCYALIESRQQLMLLNLPVAERWLRQAQLSPSEDGLRPQPLLIPIKLTLNKTRWLPAYATSRCWSKWGWICSRIMGV
ncbi:DNA mismatch repair protein mutL [Serratia plymuthica]|uniref:DNA mismatch repair protein mutL n=1 Tax=Serratia plymuthica TaxID=82996 RepID=A0A2X4X0M1_SERPL|nr:DNA mismatch repair protein mutL [Serratia plymuthica]